MVPKFGHVTGNEYISYSNSVSCLDSMIFALMNKFVFVFGQEFDICITLLKNFVSHKNIIFRVNFFRGCRSVTTVF